MIITPETNGSYKIEITDWQKELFRNLIEEVSEIISDRENPLGNLLFPIAYQNDIDANSEFDSLTKGDLEESHLSALKILEEIPEVGEVSEETLLKVMQAINILRLVLGTRLDITDEDTPIEIAEDDPDRSFWLIYHLLGENLSRIVDLLSD
ncbi:MAG: hypothetical protein CL470_03975 [Acidimicrobiaceae bacterium]|nr:hypothetical protein [Acidimicrobiaceae bacterium]|tara:strand:- start:78 stop:533 length:456 start_codon:yes stop_codon:yes gene_type:complete